MEKEVCVKIYHKRRYKKTFDFVRKLRITFYYSQFEFFITY